MERTEKFNLALNLLRKNGIDILDKKMHFNHKGEIVIGDKRLANCIVIPKLADAQMIEDLIKTQVGEKGVIENDN